MIVQTSCEYTLWTRRIDRLLQYAQVTWGILHVCTVEVNEATQPRKPQSMLPFPFKQTLR